MRVTVSGMRAWLARLGDLERKATDLDTPAAAAAAAVAGVARPPVATGALAASRTTGTAGAGVGVVAWTAPHAGFVHYGTRYMAARPFAVDALEQQTDTVTSIYAQHLDT